MASLLLVIIYIAFISLGLPDSVLGAAWPSMYEYLGTSIGSAGIITMIMYSGTAVSSFAIGYLEKKLGTAWIVIISVALTAVSMWGFSTADSFIHLCLFAIPYGLGGGGVDAALNNYVALHYKARHMSFLHCFWGIGTIISPLIMSAFLSNGGVWTQGYEAISLFQVCLLGVLILSVPLWKKAASGETAAAADSGEVSYSNVFSIKGARSAVLCFFCYCALESTTGLWAGTYMVNVRGVGIETATGCAMLFYAGITAGRFISGLIAERIGDCRLVAYGMGICAIGLMMILLPVDSNIFTFAGLVTAGLGCAPVFPSMVHLTPEITGEKGSQILIGIQLSVASAGSILIPPLFGQIVEWGGLHFLPLFSLLFCVVILYIYCGRKVFKQI